MSLGIAFKAFFAALGNREKAEQISEILSGSGIKTIAERPAESPPAAPAMKEPLKSKRDSAVTLLAALQREARLVDLIHEDLGKYSDAQVGAAARPCLQQCAAVLSRALGLKPLLDANEGQSVEVAADASPARYQWIGEGTATKGKLIHHGWQVSKVELPTWTGDDNDINVVAAAQVQAS